MKDYRFGHRINILGRMHSKRLLEKIFNTGLTSSQWPIIAHLLFHGESSQVKIAEQLAIESPTVSKALYNMELAGWITRIADQNDKREKKVTLTDKAQKTIPIWLKAIDDLQDQLLHGISNEEIEMLDQILDKLSENLMKDNLLNHKEE